MLVEMPTETMPLLSFADFNHLAAARSDRLNPLYTVYADNLPAPDELQFDYVAFRRINAEHAQLAVERGDPYTFGYISNGAVNLYLGTGATQYLVKHAIATIKLKEIRRITGSAASGADVKNTDAPGWGRYEEMTEKDYDDVKDAWMSYSATIDERKRSAEQYHNSARADNDFDGDPYGEQPTKHAKPEMSTLEVSMLEANSPASNDDEEHEHAHLYNDQGGIIDPYYSEAESDLLTDSGWGIDEPWLTGEGPGMHTFATFDEFVSHYRLYSPTDEMFWMWAEAIPDEDVDAPDAVDEEG
jgi:hypothetical protein